MQKQVRGFRRGPCERGGPKPLRSHSEPSRGLRCKKATSAGETPGSRRCWKYPLPARCPLTTDSTFARLLPLETAGRTEVAPEGRLPAAPAFQEPGRMGWDASVSPPPSCFPDLSHGPRSSVCLTQRLWRRGGRNAGDRHFCPAPEARELGVGLAVPRSLY